MSATGAREDFPQQTIWKSILFHLLPGAVITAVFLLLRPVVVGYGFPPLFAFLMAVIFIGIPFELGWLLYKGVQRNQQASLMGVVLYLDPVPLWQYFLIVPLALAAGLLLITFFISPINLYVAAALFSWLPDWFLLGDPEQYTTIARLPLWITFITRLLVIGLVFPVVEELYFRGYLLPRLSRFKAAAPLVGGFLFALYQFWAPYDFILVFGLGLLLTYLAWWKRNVWFTISLHVLANLILVLASMLLFFVYP